MGLFNFWKKNNTTIFPVGDSSASWVQLQEAGDYLQAFYNTPELYAIIAYLANSYAQVQWKHYRNGKRVENSKLELLLNYPNVLQAGSEFHRQLYAYYCIFGNAYAYGLQPFGLSLPKTLYTLPSHYMRVIATGKWLNQTKIDDIIEKYILDINGNVTEFTKYDNIYNLKNIFHKTDINVNVLHSNYVSGASRLTELKMPISNIQVAYEANNVIINKRGALGIFTTESGENAIPLLDNEKQNLQDELKKYGLKDDKWQYIFTNASLKFVPISLPVGDLKLRETIQDSCIAICNAFSFPILLLNYLQGSTFSNLKEAKKQLYQDKVIPDANDFAKEFERWLDVPDNEQLIADYSHLQIFQEDNEKLERVRGMRLKSISDLLISVSENKITVDSAIELLIDIYEFSEEKAKNIIYANTKTK